MSERTCFSRAEILVLVGGTIPPANAEKAPVPGPGRGPVTGPDPRHGVAQAPPPAVLAPFGAAI